jgi:ANTAR domain-containing protein
MEMDRAATILATLQNCTVDEAIDELLDASRRHRVPPLAVAQAFVELIEGREKLGDHASTAARYEWGYLLGRRSAS